MKHRELSDEVTRRRKAIYNGLVLSLDEGLAIKATEIWMQEFSTKPVYALQPFLSRIIEVLDVKVSRSSIQQNILKSLLKEGNDLNDVPQQLNIPEFTKPTERVNHTINASHKVFTYFMDYFLSGLFRIDSSSELAVKVYVFDNVHRLGISGTNMDKIKQWLSENGQVALIRELTLEQMQGLFHFFYIASCEHIGPVRTDKLVGESVKIVEQLPESSEFPIKYIF